MLQWGFICFYYTFTLDAHQDGAMSEQGDVESRGEGHMVPGPALFGPSTAQVLCMMMSVMVLMVLEIVAISEDGDDVCDRPIIQWHVWNLCMALPLVIWMFVYPCCGIKPGGENKFWAQAAYTMVSGFISVIGIFCTYRGLKSLCLLLLMHVVTDAPFHLQMSWFPEHAANKCRLRTGLHGRMASFFCHSVLLYASRFLPVRAKRKVAKMKMHL